MKEVLHLYGSLIIALLGIITPILIILLSLHSKGSSKLIEQYESEKNQSEKNIANLARQVNIEKIEKSIVELKASKKAADSKLDYLNPKLQIIRLFISFALALLFVILAYLCNCSYYIFTLIFISLSLICFSYGLFVLWNLLCILIEVRKLLDDEEDKLETKRNELGSNIIELLSELLKKPVVDYLEKVFIYFDEKEIKNDSNIYRMSANVKRSISVSVLNSEIIMAKKVEIGFIFPLDFIIEKKDDYSINTSKKVQLVRYKAIDLINANTRYDLSDLIITPLSEKQHKIESYINAENIKEIWRNFIIDAENINQ